MTEQPDTTTMSGAQFQRHAGTDAQKWAEAMDNEAGTIWGDEGAWPRNRVERIAFLARWFRDYAEVRVAEEVGRVLDKEWGRRYLGLDTDKLAADVKARREAAAARLVPRQE